MSSELKEGIYTYAPTWLKGKSGRVSLEQAASRRPDGSSRRFWVIRYNQGWNPNDKPLFGHATDFEVLELDYAEELISNGQLKLVNDAAGPSAEQASSPPTPVTGGRRSRRTRRKTRARKSRRYRK